MEKEDAHYRLAKPHEGGQAVAVEGARGVVPLRDKMESARRALQQTPAAVEKAKADIREGEELVVNGHKLIRIADRSENGWATMQEYVDDELADKSDDEKRLFRAELRGANKLKTAGLKAAGRKKQWPKP